MKTLQVRVLRMAAEGQAIAKAPGSDRIIFVPYGVPGDELTVEVMEEKQGFARGRILRVEKPGADRQGPPCPYHFTAGLKVEGRRMREVTDATPSTLPPRWCGGCDWQQLPYQSQLRLKRETVLDCLKRIGRLAATVLPTLASPQPWRYRNKVQVPFGSAGLPSPGLRPPSPAGGRGEGEGTQRSRIVAGFYHPGSHEIVDFDDCLVQPELAVRIVRKVKTMAGPLAWKPYDSRSHTGWLRHLFVRTNQAGQALVAFVSRTPEFPAEARAVQELTREFPAIVSLQQNVQPERTSLILGPRWRKLWGRDSIEETVGPLRLSASPGAFLQVNTGATELLYSTVQAMLLSEGFRPAAVLDLYSGVGAIALWLAPKVGKVVGVEEASQAVADAIGNAKRNGVRNVHFVRAGAEVFLRSKQAGALASPAAAVLDPPRAGCQAQVLRGLARRGVPRIVYVSCNPATFARDARILADLRYGLKRVQPVDLFPQTSHVELCALFDRAG